MFYKALDTACIGHGGVGLRQGAALARQYGFDGFFLDAGRDFTGSPREARDILARHNLRPAGFGLPLEFRGDGETFQRGLEKLAPRADFAREVGLTACVTWVMPGHDSLGYAENFALHRDRLGQAARVLFARGIRLGLEFVSPPSLVRTFRHPFIHNLEGMLGLVHEIGRDSCGLLLDAWHWQLAGQSFGDFEKLTGAGSILCAHINDAPANVPDEEQVDQARRLPGATGVLRIEEFFAGLALAGYEGPVLAEPFTPFLAKLPFDMALGVLRQHMDRVWPDYSPG